MSTDLQVCKPLSHNHLSQLTQPSHPLPDPQNKQQQNLGDEQAQQRNHVPQVVQH